MNCRETQELLHGYIDGELDLVRNLEIERHLQECSDCARSNESLQALRREIQRETPYYTAPPGLEKRLRASLRKAADAETPKPASRWRATFWRAIPVTASLAAVLLLAWLLVHRASGPSADDLMTREVVAAHIRSLMGDSHLFDVASTDQHTVKPWFAGRLDFSPPVQDLAAQGFPLVGGRLDYLDDRPVAALVYLRQKHRINLFLWPASPSATTSVETLARRGYNLVHWTRSGMNWWAVSDLNSAELQAFAGLLK